MRPRECSLPRFACATLGLAFLVGASPPDDNTRPEQEAPWCVEKLPNGYARPEIKVKPLGNTSSGHVVDLEVEVGAASAEEVMPQGLLPWQHQEFAERLKKIGILVPAADAQVTVRTKRTAQEQGRDRVTVLLPLIALPPLPGRGTLTIPPLPIEIRRASGELVRLCLPPQSLQVEDPIANEANPVPRGNPPPRIQREDWPAARWALWGLLGGALLSALLWWLWQRRPPKPNVPVALVVRPAWELALERLDALRTSSLLQEGEQDPQKFAEHFDEVDNAVRAYLGARYGFDGLECTSTEMRQRLRRITPPIPVLPLIGHFLDRGDLIKFAKQVPTREQSLELLEHGIALVHATVPVAPGGPIP